MRWISRVYEFLKLPLQVCVVAGVLVPAVVLAGDGQDGARPEREWVLPAAFVGQGAVTIGCRFWDAPVVTPYGPENPDTNFAAGGFSPESFAAIVDGPHGMALLSGKDCGIGIDWRRFPEAGRPAD